MFCRDSVTLIAITRWRVVEASGGLFIGILEGEQKERDCFMGIRGIMEKRRIDG